MMKSHKLSATVSLFAILLPIAVSAAAWERLNDDVSAWTKDSANDQSEQAQQTAEQDFNMSKELYPDPGVNPDEPISRLDEVRKDRIDGFVNVQTPAGLLVFNDAPRSAWFAPYVRDIAERGLMSGYRDSSGNLTGKFGPDDPVTVEQMGKVLVSALGVSPLDCPKVTKNVSASGSWSAPYMACAEKNLWSLYAGGFVDAHRPATRAEVVTSVLEAFRVEPMDNSGSIFTDVTQTMTFGSYIAQAKRDGIVAGYTDANGDPTGVFGPDDFVNRAAFAKIMTLGIQVYGKKSRTSSVSSSSESSQSSSSVSSEVLEP